MRRTLTLDRTEFEVSTGDHVVWFFATHTNHVVRVKLAPEEARALALTLIQASYAVKGPSL
jgi:hypothetical protein